MPQTIEVTLLLLGAILFLVGVVGGGTAVGVTIPQLEKLQRIIIGSFGIGLIVYLLFSLDKIPSGKRKVIGIIVVAVLLMLGLSAAVYYTPTSESSVTATPTPTHTSLPTDTATPTNTPISIGGVEGGTQRLTDTPTPTTNATATFTSTPSPSLTSTPTPTVTPSTTPVTMIISGKQESGMIFNVESAGKYKITIVSGAYSPWPTENSLGNQWRTIIHIYKNRPIEWGLTEYNLTQPINPDYAVGVWELPTLPTQSQAEAAGKGKNILIDLQAGDSLIFVPIDVQTAYTNPSNNRGEVILEITKVSQ